MEMSHTSYWTIGANPRNPVQLGDGGRVQQCNLFLQPDVYLPDGQNTPLTGFRPADLDPVLIFEQFTQPASLENREYTSWFAGFGFYFYPGCSGNYVQRKIGVINAVYNASEPWTTQTCRIGRQTCDQEFAQFILQQNQGHPINSVYPGSGISGHYSSLGACEADPGAPCQGLTYTCVADGTTRQYFVHSNN